MKKPKQSTSNQDQSDALEALGRKVKAAQQAREPELDQERTGWAVGIRYASEFSAAVIVGGLLGFLVDYFVGTTPWGLLAGMILGFMAGTRSIVRIAKEMSADDGATQTSQKD